jgi:hypothetical protein
MDWLDNVMDIFDPGGILHTSKADRNYNETVDEQAAESQATYDKMEQMLTDYNNNRFRFATPKMQQKYIESMENFEPNNYVYDFGQFGYDKTVDDFINPNRDKILADVGKGVQGTAAGAGLGLSRGTVDNAIAAQMDKSEQLWKDAYDQYNRDKDFEYKKYADDITNNQNRLNTLADLTTGQQQALAGAIGKDQTGDSQYWTDMISLLGDKQQQANALALAQRDNQAERAAGTLNLLKFFA